MNTGTDEARYWLEKIHALELTAPVKIMNVCGGHERTITHEGLRSVLPASVRLIAGPGCPVCVCAEEDIYHAIEVSLHGQVILAAFGDMLRVPINLPKGSIRSLEQARAHGADIRPVASPSEVARIAVANPDREVVFFAAGFETTIAPVAALLAQGAPANLSVLLAGKLTWPAVAMLLEDQPAFHALVAPGHVSTIMGAQQWSFVTEQYRMPVAIAGFQPHSLLAAFYSVLRQHQQQHACLENCYPQAVRAHGNPTAVAILEQTLEVCDSNWRGVGTIARSGYALRGEYRRFDARRRFTLPAMPAHKNRGHMPTGCECAQVVLGKIEPVACRLYEKACTPATPMGPCMVSDEGACRIWWSSGVRHSCDEL